MVFGNSCGFTCESQCPPHHVAIQPPPFCITVPGPRMSASNDDSCAVSCDAPCSYGCGGGYGGWGGYGGFGGYGGYGCGGGYGGYGGYGGRGYGFSMRCAGGYGVRGC